MHDASGSFISWASDDYPLIVWGIKTINVDKSLAAYDCEITSLTQKRQTPACQEKDIHITICPSYPKSLTVPVSDEKLIPMLTMPIVGSERILWRGETPTRMEFQLQGRILFHSFLGQNICKVRIIVVTLQRDCGHITPATGL